MAHTIAKGSIIYSVVGIFAEILLADPKNFGPSSKLSELDCDKLDIEHIIMRVEEKFHIEFDDWEITQLITLMDIVDLVHSALVDDNIKVIKEETIDNTALQATTEEISVEAKAQVVNEVVDMIVTLLEEDTETTIEDNNTEKPFNTLGDLFPLNLTI